MSQQLKKMHSSLMEEWRKGSARNLDVVSERIKAIKIEFAEGNVLPSSEESTGLDVLQIQRDVYEVNAELALLKRDIPAFLCALGQLKHYYSEIGSNLDRNVSESPLKYQMLGLDLMYLLSQKKLADFHMELEKIPVRVAKENPYIQTPVTLEQALMEGAYNKIFLSKANTPSPYYAYFMDILLDAVRDEIGQCIEKAYERLSVKEAARLLFFDGSPTEALKKALDYGEKRTWRLEGKDTFIFAREAKKIAADAGLDTERLARDNIFYAKQLEMIP